MKIVSLQSVGLGAIFRGGNGNYGFNKPYIITVGENLYNGRGYSLDVTVTEITHLSDYLTNKDTNDIIPDYYKVHTSDGHIRVLPEQRALQNGANSYGTI